GWRSTLGRFDRPRPASEATSPVDRPGLESGDRGGRHRLGGPRSPTAKKRLTLGHDPWSRPRATLGGAIGTNGIGYAGYLRGTMGDQVLGLESVLADGTILRTRPAVRSTTGLDLRRLFIGTEGTLGIVTAATLRVF